MAAAAVAAPEADSGTGWFYAQNGTAVGPLPASVLTSLAQNGTLRSDDPVWQVGAEVAAPARQTPFLVPIFTTSASKPSSTGKGAVTDTYLESVTRGQTTTLIFRGAVMVLFVMLPVAVFRTGQEREMIWWWDSFRIGDGVGFGIVHLLNVLAGIAVVVLAATLTNVPRAASLMGVAGAATLAWMILWGAAALDSPEALDILVILGIVPALYLVSSINLFRLNSGAGTTDAGKLTQGLCAGFLLLVCVLWIISGVMDITNLPEEIPGWAIAALILELVAAGGAAAGGILSLVDLKPQYSRGVLVGSVVCCWAAAATLATAVLVFMSAIDREIANAPIPLPGVSASLIWVILRHFVLYVLPISIFASALVALLAHRSSQRA